MRPRVVLLLPLLLTLRAEDVVPSPVRTHTDGSAEPRTTRSWEMPAITVPGSAASQLREEDRIGSYGQPRWTARRRFAETRVYVVPEGQFEFEYWLIVKDRKRRDHDGEAQVKQVYEAELGLPYRFQLDLYQVYEKEGGDGPNQLAETKFEVRWALADWDELWGNPTLYAEWVAVNGGYDHAEGKLLLGGEATERWHWGANLVWEEEVGGARERAWEMTHAISYCVRDSRFAVGIEDKLALITTNADRQDDETEILLGPTIQCRPIPQMHLNLSVLPGLTQDSPVSKTVAVIGWEF